MKWRFFRHLLGGNDPDAEKVYRWHIKKRSGHRMAAGMTTDRWKAKLDDYVKSATDLLKSMQGGWRGEPIPIDPDGELLDGSHRVACAIALGIPEVPVVSRWNYVWAPRWDIEWFWRNGMPDAELQQAIDDWGRMKA